MFSFGRGGAEAHISEFLFYLPLAKIVLLTKRENVTKCFFLLSPSKNELLKIHLPNTNPLKSGPCRRYSRSREIWIIIYLVMIYASLRPGDTYLFWRIHTYVNGSLKWGQKGKVIYLFRCETRYNWPENGRSSPSNNLLWVAKLVLIYTYFIYFSLFWFAFLVFDVTTRFELWYTVSYTRILYREKAQASSSKGRFWEKLEVTRKIGIFL